jgi:putative phosphotransacetylase
MMTEAELARLADLVAKALIDANRGADRKRRATGGEWVLAPVRPEPPARGGEPPAWSGAAQTLSDVAPGDGLSRARVSTAELTNAARAAAAGRAPPRERRATSEAPAGGRARGRGAPSIEVKIGVSNRHVHLSPAHVRTLFGSDSLGVDRPITQPGQFAAKEMIDVVGPRGRLTRLRVVGPARGETQLELALSDTRAIGVTAPVAASGSLQSSAGGVTLVGPAGSVVLDRGVIVAARHLHLAPDDARRWGLRDGDKLDVRVGSGARAAILHDVLVRSGPGHATELHLDTDEASAVGVKTGERATIIAWRSTVGGKRPLLTERDVVELARRQEKLPANALLTPSARDRARALHLLDS